MSISLIISSFIAGLLTFLAPCTLPLVPGYLGFISGVSAKDLADSNKQTQVRKNIMLNGLFYVIGFSFIFIILGSLFGLIGYSLGESRIWLSRIGGVFVVFFGLYLMHVFKLPFFGFLNNNWKINIFTKLKPGNPFSSLLFGMTFAFGWTPCIGPIFGTILLLASSSATVFKGAFLLSVFSLGLSIPFLLIAFSLGKAVKYINKYQRYLDIVSVLGGLLLVFLGILLITNNFASWISYFYRIFNFLNYDSLLKYL